MGIFLAWCCRARKICKKDMYEYVLYRKAGTAL